MTVMTKFGKKIEDCKNLSGKYLNTIDNLLHTVKTKNENIASLEEKDEMNEAPGAQKIFYSFWGRWMKQANYFLKEEAKIL